jgi:iron complex outermembrane recepter protein
MGRPTKVAATAGTGNVVDKETTRRNGVCGRASIGVLAILTAWGLALRSAAAQTPIASENLPQIIVIGTSPLPGTGIDPDKLPASVQSLSAADIAREGSPDLVGSILDQTGSVNTNANLDDPFQPDLLFRGFEASPVLGTPQGIAVYQSGVRINEPFGDTVNWDLVPDIAIDRIDILSANPVYGLNALGGAAVVTMKNGFGYHGFDSELEGGSFGETSGNFEYGKSAGNFAAYLAGRVFNDQGWRQFSPDNVQQLYADLAARGERAKLDVSFTGADNTLSGEGAVPEQELAFDRAFDFTTPQVNRNELEFVIINGSYDASDTLSFQGNAYRREFHQSVVNGNTTSYTACMPANGFMCEPDGMTPLMSLSGAAIPDLSDGGTVPIGELDRETIHTIGTGGALQTTYTRALFDRPNNLVFGGSIDHAATDFQSSAELGTIDSALQVGTSGLFAAIPENSAFVATPVSLTASNTYYGVYVSDTLDLSDALSVTASGRLNLAQIDLSDHNGSELSGDSSYDRFNPAIGAAYKLAANLTAYAGYSEGNRVPTPSEIECSNPLQSCLLPSSLSADPPKLKQVVSSSSEAGLRGNFTLSSFAPGKFTWHGGLYRTDLSNDIYGVATSISAGFFENIGSTRRQGVEAGLAYDDKSWSVYGAYSLVDATFQSPLTIPSPNNPFADMNGNIHVVPGDRLPGIPEHQLKVGVDYHLTPDWVVGGVLTFFSDQYLRGDESNQNPTLPAYFVVNLHTSYKVTEHFELFARVENALDAHYSTFGQYGDPTGIGAPGIPPGAVTNGPGVDNRFVSPAPPVAIYGGVRVRF